MEKLSNVHSWLGLSVFEMFEVDEYLSLFDMFEVEKEVHLRCSKLVSATVFDSFQVDKLRFIKTHLKSEDDNSRVVIGWIKE